MHCLRSVLFQSHNVRDYLHWLHVSQRVSFSHITSEGYLHWLHVSQRVSFSHITSEITCTGYMCHSMSVSVKPHSIDAATSKEGTFIGFEEAGTDGEWRLFQDVEGRADTSDRCVSRPSKPG